MCCYHSISFSCMAYNCHVKNAIKTSIFMILAHVDIIVMVSKMFRGHLTAGVLAIGVTVVLISEIDTNCHTISA